MASSICLPFNNALAAAFPIFLVLFHLSDLLSARPDFSPSDCGQPQFCGKINISYPFHNSINLGCGVELLRCINGFTAVIDPGEENADSTYEVQSINYIYNTILAHDRRFTQGLLNDDDICNALFNNFTMPPIFRSLSAQLISKNLTLRACKRHQELHGGSPVGPSRDCIVEALPDVPDDAPAPPPSPHGSSYNCKLLHLPLDVPPSTFHGPVDSVSQLFIHGFRLRWSLPPQCHQCDKNRALCLWLDNYQQFYCFDPKDRWNNKEKGINRKKAMVTAVVTSFIFVITLVATLGYYLIRKLSSDGLMPFRKKRTRNTQNVEAFLKDHGSLAPKRYSYSDIKKMTNSFKEKVGQDGYGGVFKGKLPNGRLVAVKVLDHSKGNGEEFINEVASICRTSHVNIVTLLGFCFDGSKRALIYEFMSNGSLEKFIYKTCPHLGWERLYQVAIGIAQGLEYLHRGCNTCILHFDIKPHNILLDEYFCPKIFDFGLAKLCPTKNSIVSMADARGTIGYIAPEVFSRNFGGVSHKSDVYSYGMMILEMVGGRRNFDGGVNHTSERYFPDWIYKHIEQGENLQLDMITREEDDEIARKMVLVGLWCIQMDPANRPSISRVVDMLKGNLESLPIPPKPYFSSPPRELSDLFNTSTS